MHNFIQLVLSLLSKVIEFHPSYTCSVKGFCSIMWGVAEVPNKEVS